MTNMTKLNDEKTNRNLFETNRNSSNNMRKRLKKERRK